MPFFLPASVNHDNVLALEEQGLSDLTQLKTVDCTHLEDFDSTVLTVLLAWQKQLQKDGQQLTLTHSPEKLKTLAGVYGVSALLGFS
ncbi:phospholipid transport system transporter-binding protein [Polynucleobacter meluiroseus]|jgi:phospholipid transport system transporter-binding protein|uniref:Phospholipid transport system transporter-binding protein n=1 Tax=Polynucleobacter meluiroseus TaxID=1938814 RepID=A0A240E0D0_9BURK|nr:STAS domain-containing protein [Polynucleobacter meluiroseus]SNX28895.1 phospholipid transport system transporter-binding protein [Polynucleobacter meluiroseus]